jgi:heptosyltransferase-3
MSDVKILVIKFRNIGDVLLSTPLIENLRHFYPDAVIDVAVNKESEQMLTLNPYLNNVIVYDRQGSRNLGLWSRIREGLRFAYSIRRAEYDIVISLTEGDRPAIIALMSGAARRFGRRPRSFPLKYVPIYHRHFQKPSDTDRANPDWQPSHVVEKDLSFLAFLGHEPVSKRVSIFWDSKDARRVAGLLDSKNLAQFVQVHPVARWGFKCWPDDRTAAVIDYIQKDQGCAVVVTAGPSAEDKAKIKRILSYCKTEPVNLAGELSLKELACLSSMSRLFVGVDTAAMHIAAAVGTPVLALFGNSQAPLWGPWDNEAPNGGYRKEISTQRNGRHTLLQHPGAIVSEGGKKVSTALQKISVDEVSTHIDRMLQES